MNKSRPKGRFPVRLAVASTLVGAAVGSALGIAAAQTDGSTTSTSDAAAVTTTTAAPAAPETTTSTAAPETTTSTAAPETTTTTAAPPPTSTTPAANGSANGSAATAPDGHGHEETPLTGETADKVKAAALAAVPGATIDRVETDAEGSPYEAHMTKSDGTHVTVKVDASFKVTAVEAGGPGGHGPGGPGGHGHGRGPGGPAGGETPLTGDTADRVRTAAQAAVPGGTVDRVETDSDGSPYEAHVTKSDGTHVTVKVGSD